MLAHRTSSSGDGEPTTFLADRRFEPPIDAESRTIAENNFTTADPACSFTTNPTEGRRGQSRSISEGEGVADRDETATELA